MDEIRVELTQTSLLPASDGFLREHTLPLKGSSLRASRLACQPNIGVSDAALPRELSSLLDPAQSAGRAEFTPSFETATAAGTMRRRPSIATPSFRRELQKNASGEQIPTGKNGITTGREITETSVIVLVTSSGNVTLFAN